ncbi:MAG: YigZ family protein [Lachnotalea sp.]
MVEYYKAVYVGGEAEIVEKKSRFIATVIPIKTQEEAALFIEEVKKKHWNAKHNCFAFVVGANNEIQRCSDDGEPSQTAGKPILDILIGEGLHNTAIVVTRYFGGTLLGTGGLVRAYSKAAKEGIGNSVIIEKKYGIKLSIITDYNGIGKIQYLLSQKGVTTISSDYTDIVAINVLVPFGAMEELENAVIEATSAQAEIIELEQIYFAQVGSEIICFQED